MTLVERIHDDLKTAMREGQAVRRDTLRLLIADLKYKRIELMIPALDDEQALAVLRSAMKRRQESIEQYDKGARPELAARERAELEVIEGYLPKQLNEDQVRAAVNAAIAEVGAKNKKDTGAVMKALMAKHKGAIDGKAANRILSELLP